MRNQPIYEKTVTAIKEMREESKVTSSSQDIIHAAIIHLSGNDNIQFLCNKYQSY